MGRQFRKIVFHPKNIDMIHDLVGLSRRYVTALRKHLKQGACARFLPARELGCQAAASGMNTSEFTQIHKQAVAALDLSNGRPGLTKRAELFFSEASYPIVEATRAARQAMARKPRLLENGGRHTAEPADACATGGERHGECLAESLQLQKRLRQLAHRVLVGQEDERMKLSHELHDELAQILLGIDVRLLLLKQAARGTTGGLKNEIASTQRLVAKSAASVRRFARELNRHRPTSRERNVMAI
jgi:two-component system sensor histidine kinase DegS